MYFKHNFSCKRIHHFKFKKIKTDVTDMREIKNENLKSECFKLSYQTLKTIKIFTQLL